jgi:hypothetical protein
LPGQGYTPERLTSRYGKGEAWLNFSNKIPVHITYQTAYVDDAGSLVVRDDMYGLDSRVLAAFKGDDRSYAVAEEEFTSFKRNSFAGKRTAVREEPSPIENFFGRLFR